MPITITFGYDEGGIPKEVFAKGPKEGTEMAHLIDDACVVISLALQHGATPAGLAKSLGSVPDYDRGGDVQKPASVLGTILAALIETQHFS
jgi:hypothetical protein